MLLPAKRESLLLHLRSERVGSIQEHRRVGFSFKAERLRRVLKQWSKRISNLNSLIWECKEVLLVLDVQIHSEMTLILTYSTEHSYI